MDGQGPVNRMLTGGPAGGSTGQMTSLAWPPLLAGKPAESQSLPAVQGANSVPTTAASLPRTGSYNNNDLALSLQLIAQSALQLHAAQQQKHGLPAGSGSEGPAGSGASSRDNINAARASANGPDALSQARLRELLQLQLRGGPSVVPSSSPALAAAAVPASVPNSGRRLSDQQPQQQQQHTARSTPVVDFSLGNQNMAPALLPAGGGNIVGGSAHPVRVRATRGAPLPAHILSSGIVTGTNVRGTVSKAVTRGAGMMGGLHRKGGAPPSASPAADNTGNGFPLEAPGSGRRAPRPQRSAARMSYLGMFAGSSSDGEDGGGGDDHDGSSGSVFDGGMHYAAGLEGSGEGEDGEYKAAAYGSRRGHKRSGSASFVPGTGTGSYADSSDASYEADEHEALKSARSNYGDLPAVSSKRQRTSYDAQARVAFAEEPESVSTPHFPQAPHAANVLPRGLRGTRGGFKRGRGRGGARGAGRFGAGRTSSVAHALPAPSSFLLESQPPSLEPEISGRIMGLDDCERDLPAAASITGTRGAASAPDTATMAVVAAISALPGLANASDGVVLSTLRQMDACGVLGRVSPSRALALLRGRATTDGDAQGAGAIPSSGRLPPASRAPHLSATSGASSLLSPFGGAASLLSPFGGLGFGDLGLGGMGIASGDPASFMNCFQPSSTGIPGALLGHGHGVGGLCSAANTPYADRSRGAAGGLLWGSDGRPSSRQCAGDGLGAGGAPPPPRRSRVVYRATRTPGQTPLQTPQSTPLASGGSLDAFRPPSRQLAMAAGGPLAASSLGCASGVLGSRLPPLPDDEEDDMSLHPAHPSSSAATRSGGGGGAHSAAIGCPPVRSSSGSPGRTLLEALGMGSPTAAYFLAGGIVSALSPGLAAAHGGAGAMGAYSHMQAPSHEHLAPLQHANLAHPPPAGPSEAEAAMLAALTSGGLSSTVASTMVRNLAPAIAAAFAPSTHSGARNVIALSAAVQEPLTAEVCASTGAGADVTVVESTADVEIGLDTTQIAAQAPPAGATGRSAGLPAAFRQSCYTDASGISPQNSVRSFHTNDSIGSARGTGSGSGGVARQPASGSCSAAAAVVPTDVMALHHSMF